MGWRECYGLWPQEKIKWTSSDEFQSYSLRRAEEALSWNSTITTTYWAKESGPKQCPLVKWPS